MIYYGFLYWSYDNPTINVDINKYGGVSLVLNVGQIKQWNHTPLRNKGGIDDKIYFL